MDANPTAAPEREAQDASFMLRSGTLSGRVVLLTRLRILRERALLTQAELAKEAKVSRSTLALIEAGERHPHPATIRKLAEALDVKPTDLMGPEPRS